MWALNGFDIKMMEKSNATEKKIQILGVVLDLVAYQHSQSNSL